MTDGTDPIAAVASEAPDLWDERAIDPPGGHVLQGAAWAAHRASLGWTPHFLTFASGRVALILEHRRAPLPGFTAYAPRGPIHAGDAPDAVAVRAAALAAWVRERGGTIIAVDPELDASADYETALARAGFVPTEEIQPSRHRLVLTFEPGDDDESTFGRVAKGTRQRIRGAERAGIRVVEDREGRHLGAFAALADATAARKRFTLSAEQGFGRWWRAVIASGRARFWVALHDERLLGGLIAYRQGGHLATAFSADDAASRRDLPGTMHLLRWEAIRAALAAGHPSIDLGGVDVRGARDRPSKGAATYGMFEHKASFGAVWVESAQAHEIVIRPVVYRLSLAAGRARRILRRVAAR